VDQVLDRVVQRDDVEACRGKIEILETAGGHADTASPRLGRRERGDLNSFNIPARRLGFEQEVAERAANIKETTATTVSLLDRADAIAERAAVYVGVEEIVGVPALRVVGGVVIAVVDRRRRERSR